MVNLLPEQRYLPRVGVRYRFVDLAHDLGMKDLTDMIWHYNSCTAFAADTVASL